MRDSNSTVTLRISDFNLSDTVSAEATSTTVLWIDFYRMFKDKTGDIKNPAFGGSFSIPIIGSFLDDKTSNYALYELMEDNPGYDVVFFPKFETEIFKPVLGIGLLTTVTTVKVTARLGKLNSVPKSSPVEAPRSSPPKNEILPAQPAAATNQVNEEPKIFHHTPVPRPEP